jgi:hypothetical protein
MHFRATLLAALAVGTTTVSALGNIYIGTITGCGSYKFGPDWWVWFVGDPVCTEGTNLGPTSFFGNGLCGKNVTIATHNNITFTGCPELPCGAPPHPGPPTGVSDSGELALKCCPVYNLPSQHCFSSCGERNITTYFQCSNVVGVHSSFAEEL